MSDDRAPAPISEPYALNPGELPKIKSLGGRPGKRLSLTAEQLRVNEIWMRSEGTREQRVNLILRTMQTRYSTTMTGQQVLDALKLHASGRYRKRLKDRVRNVALRRLAHKIPEVVEDYNWARDAAREQGDYKETRMAAVDHLDRLGVTLKKEAAPQQVQVLVLRGRNFDVASLEAPTPTIEAVELVREDDALEDGEHGGATG